MGRSKQKSGGMSELLFFVSAKNMKPGADSRPYFELRAKKNGKWEVDDEITEMTGYIRSVKVEWKEISIGSGKKQKKRVFVLDIVDPTTKEHYILENMMTNSVRSLVNMMLNVEDFKQECRLSVYRNKAGYANITIGFWNHEKDEFVWAGFKYENKVLNEKYIKEVVVNGETVRDFSKFDEWIEKAVNEGLAKKDVNSVALPPTKEEEKKAATAEMMSDLGIKSKEVETEEDTDLPF